MTFDRPLALSARLSRARRLRTSLRALALGAAAAGLAGPSLPRPAPGVRVEIVDASASFRARRALGEGFLRDVQARLGEEDGGRAAPARTVRIRFARDVAGGDAEPADPLGTDLASAIRTACDIAGDAGGDAILLSDGLATTPGALDAARTAAARGFPVHVHLPPDAGLPALAIAAVRAPDRARPGEPLRIGVSLLWNGRVAAEGDEAPPGIARGGPLPATIEVASGGAAVATARTAMPAGGGAASVEVEIDAAAVARLAGTRGLVELEIQVGPALPGDPVPEARRARAVVRLDGPARLLLACDDEALAAALAPALRGFLVTPVGGDDVPPEPARLLPFSIAVVADVPLERLGRRSAEAIAAAVDAGMGLVAIGAPRAFGPGGWAGSGLERALPVEVEPRTERSDRLALAVLIDRSGSMGEPADARRTKIAAAIDALRPLDRLRGDDRLAVFSFSREVETVLPIGPPVEAGRLRAALGAIRPTGPTDIFPAIRAGLEAVLVSSVEAERRRVVLLTDGRSDATPPPEREKGIEAIASLRERDPRVTLSVVAIGPDVDLDLLGRVASAGGGRLERAGLGGRSLEEALDRALDPRRAELLVPGPLAVREREAGWLPAPVMVARAVRVAPRSTARVTLETETSGALLAIGPRGAGRSAALATDDVTPLQEPLARTLSEVARPGLAPGASIRATIDGAAMRLEADMRDPAGGAFRSGLSLEARVTGAAGASVVPLVEVAPGLYAARAPAPAEPSVVALFEASAPTRPLATSALFAPRPAELSPIPPDRALLRAIAETTGGRFLAPGELPSAPPGRGVARPLLPWLALAAAALFLTDLAVEARDSTRLS